MIGPYSTLSTSTPEEGVLVVTLDRPDRLNAITVEMFAELEQVAADITAAGRIRVVILTGAGRGFCAGYDLAEAEELPNLTAMEMLDRQELGMRALLGVRELRVPVIAAVNGPAAGGGLSLALAADIRLGAPQASFTAAFTRIGLSIGDLGASWLLPRIIGPAAAAELAFTGGTIGAQEAYRLRLLNRIVEDGDVVAAAVELASRIAGNSPAGVRLSKRALQANLEVASYAAALELENRGQTLLTRTDDMGEALQAFLEKRPARFENR